MEVLAQLAAIVESSQDAIVGQRLDGAIETWNAAANALYGYTAAEVLGKSIALLLPQGREHEDREILRRSKRANGSTTLKPCVSEETAVWLMFP